MESCIPPVDELSQSSSEETAEARPQPDAPRRRVKRSRKRDLCKRGRPAVDDIVRVQHFLSKNCARKSGSCRDLFRAKSAQRELLDFRADWAKLHKLDQDEVVP